MGSAPSKSQGTVVCNKGNFGFIQQDAGGSDMMVLPPVPDVGARVSYDVIVDPKSNRPRAENVQVLASSASQAASWSSATLPVTAVQSASAPSDVALHQAFGSASQSSLLRSQPY